MCREYCAYNLPAVTSFVHNMIPQKMEIWDATFKDLAGDPCYLVRKAVASCIHNISRVLGKNHKLSEPPITHYRLAILKFALRIGNCDFQLHVHLYVDVRFIKAMVGLVVLQTNITEN